MARKFYTPIDLTGLELQNATVQNLASDPSPYGKGHVYFNTVHNELRVYDGTAWEPVGGAVMYGNTAGRPAAGNAGRVYADTQAQVLYIDNGTQWTQIGVSPSDLSTAISNAALASTDALPEGVTNLYFTNQRAIDAVQDTTLTFSNKTFKGPVYFQSGGGAGGSNNYIDVDNNTGDLTVRSNYAANLYAQNQLTLTSGGADIVLNADGSSYLGSVSPNNRIATIGDVTTAEISVLGTDNQIAVSQNGTTFTISLPSYIDVPNGELHLKKTEYWLDGSQYGVIDANPYSGNFNIVSTGRTLELEAQSGSNILLNANGNATIVKDGWFNSSANNNYFRNNVRVGIDNWNENYQDGLLEVYRASGNRLLVADSDSSYVEITDQWNNNKFRFRPDSSRLQLNNYAWLQFNGGDASDEQGEIYIDGGLYLWSTNEIGINSGNNRVYIEADNGYNIDFYNYGGGKVVVHGSQEINNDLTVGVGNDGTFEVKNAGGDNIFNVDSGANEAVLRGTLYVRKPDNTQILSIHGEGGNEAIIENGNGDIILSTDGYSYLQSNGSDSNKIATLGDVQAAVAGLTWKDSANLLWDDSGATLTGATGTLIIDGHAALGPSQAGYRILITNGTNAGIWSYADDGDNWTLTRTVDADTYQELKGASIFIMEGTTYGATSWTQSNHYLTDFTGQNWVQFSGSGTYVAGDGIAVVGREISVHADDTLQFTGGALGVKYGDGITTTMGGAIVAHLGTGLIIVNGAITNDTDNGYGVRKYATSIGNGSATSIDVTHNFGTTDVTVTIYDNTTKQEVFADVTHASNKVTIDFAAAPTSNQFRVVVVG